MSIVNEIESAVVTRERSGVGTGEHLLSPDFQELFDKGIIKPRGYTLQTIDERQRNLLSNNISYSLRS